MKKMKSVIVGVLVAVILSLPVAESQTAVSYSALPPSARVKAAQEMYLLITEETEAAMAAALETRGRAQDLKILSSQVTLPPPPSSGGGSGNPGTSPPGMPKPQFLIYLGMALEALVIGVIGYFLWSSWKHGWEVFWDKVFNPPPPTPPPPQTNSPAFSLPANVVVSVSDPDAVAGRNITALAYADNNGAFNTTYTNVMQTTIQCTENLQLPFTNFLTFTVWESPAGSLLRIKDRNFNPIYTNYTRRDASGHVLFNTPFNEALKPLKFYRNAAIPQ